jgi:hypothetical protein
LYYYTENNQCPKELDAALVQMMIKDYQPLSSIEDA